MKNPIFEIKQFHDHWIVTKRIDGVAYGCLNNNFSISAIAKRFPTKEDAEEALAKYMFAQEHLKKLRENKLPKKNWIGKYG